MFRVMISAILLSSTLFLAGCGAKKANVENPWVDCGKNIEQASEVAGFYFPLDLSEYNETGEYSVDVDIEGADLKVEYLSKTSKVNIIIKK